MSDDSYDQFVSKPHKAHPAKLPPGTAPRNGGGWRGAPLAQDPWAGFQEATRGAVGQNNPFFAMDAPKVTPGQWASAPLANPASQPKLTPVDYDPWETGKPVDYGTALQYGIANAIPFAHDIGAAIQAGETYLPKSLRVDDTGPEPDSGTSFGDRFAAQKQRIGDTDRAVNAQYPYTSAVAPIAASVGVLPFAGPTEAAAGAVRSLLPSASNTVARSAGAGLVGAGYGALYGAGTGDTAQDRLANAERGATVGGIGGAAASPLAEGANWAAQRLLTSPENAASNIIVEKMAQDRNLPAPQMSAADATAAQNSGQPVAVADMGGQSVRRLARAAANSSPAGDSVLSTLANERFEDQGPRLANFLQNMYGSNLNAASAVRILMAWSPSSTSRPDRRPSRTRAMRVVPIEHLSKQQLDLPHRQAFAD